MATDFSPVCNPAQAAQTAATATPDALSSAPLRRLALLTGGSRGLGLALGQVLTHQGFHLVEFSRSAPHPWSVPLDLADPAAVPAVVRHTLSTLDTDSLDELIVIGNAAVLQPLGPLPELAPQSVITGLQANLVGPVLWMASVLAHFQSHPARKVLAQVSSGAALRPHAGLALYGAAKAAMEQVLRTVALEQEQQPQPFITVCVDPGALDTDMQAQLRQAPAAQVPAAGDFVERRLQGRLSPCDVAADAIVAHLRNPALLNGSRWHLRDATSSSAGGAPTVGSVGRGVELRAVQAVA